MPLPEKFSLLNYNNICICTNAGYFFSFNYSYYFVCFVLSAWNAGVVTELSWYPPQSLA